MNAPTITREMRRQLDRDNAKHPVILTEVPRNLWPDLSRMTKMPCSVWRSRFFLVQGYEEENKILRLSIARTSLGPDGSWNDGLTWDEIQEIKRQIGLAEFFAVEVYPRDRDIVNVANLRHIWVLPEPLAFAWKKS